MNNVEGVTVSDEVASAIMGAQPSQSMAFHASQVYSLMTDPVKITISNGPDQPGHIQTVPQISLLKEIYKNSDEVLAKVREGVGIVCERQDKNSEAICKEVKKYCDTVTQTLTANQEKLQENQTVGHNIVCGKIHAAEERVSHYARMGMVASCAAAVAALAGMFFSQRSPSAHASHFAPQMHDQQMQAQRARERALADKVDKLTETVNQLSQYAQAQQPVFAALQHQMHRPTTVSAVNIPTPAAAQTGDAPLFG